VIERVSKPGRRIYVGVDEIPKVYNGLGISILSTPKGVLSDREAKKLRVSGELICKVF
jgi:small subunit ribosomal protein S8